MTSNNPTTTKDIQEQEQQKKELKKMIKAEKALEEGMRKAGVERYLRMTTQTAVDGQESRKATVRAAMRQLLPTLADQIQAQCESGLASFFADGIAILHGLLLTPEDYKVLALITLQSVFNSLTQMQQGRVKLTSTAAVVGQNVWQEYALRSLQPKERKWISTRWAKINTPNARKRCITAYLERAREYDRMQREVTQFQLEASDAIKLGCALIKCLSACNMEIDGVTVPVITIETDGRAKAQNQGPYNYCYVLRTSPEFLNWITDTDSALANALPIHRPMVCPPLDWSTLDNGGYLTIRKPFILNMRKDHRDYINKIGLKGIRKHMAAINRIQATPYRINRKVMETMEALLSADSPVLPQMPPEGLLRCPLCGEIITGKTPTGHSCFNDAENAEALQTYKRNAELYYSSQASQASKKMSVVRTLAIAKEYVDYDKIYFPHRCDYRGRTYPVPEYLSPQGPDYSKGLLEFSAGKKVTDKNAILLYQIHGAGLFLTGKNSVAEQLEWTRTHEPEIRMWAEDPVANQGWADADKPWQFLAWAIDYAGWLQDPQTYASHAIITMDGSCNGLQHLSMLTRDAIGGAHVNLVPADGLTDKPRDIYQVVADAVREEAMLFATYPSLYNIYYPSKQKNEDEESTYTEDDISYTFRRLLDIGITRKTVKRCVMVVPYSGKWLTMQESLVDDWLLPEKDKQLQKLILDYKAQHIPNAEARAYADIETLFPFSAHPEEGRISIRSCSTLLTRIVWAVIHNTIPGAVQVMQTISRFAYQHASRTNQPLLWVSPSGFPAYQSNPQLKDLRVETALGLKLTLRMPNEDIAQNPHAASNASAPNFVHSLDAAALAVTVANMPEGTSYAMVHDSYGTHASDAMQLHDVLRRAFIRIHGPQYEGRRPLELLLTLNNTDLKDPIDYTLPPDGDLQVDNVLQSLYFFS